MKWIKIWVKETLYGTTFQELEPAERGIWFSLLLIAASKKREGIVEVRTGEAYPLEILAFEVNCNKKTLEQAIEKLIKVGKVKRLEWGGLEICNWNKYQSAYLRRITKGKEKEVYDDQEKSSI